MQVFKIFDKKNEGVIAIEDVYEMISKFDQGNSIIGSSSTAQNDQLSKAKTFNGKPSAGNQIRSGNGAQQ